MGTAKQRINSGFYLHKADLKIKKEKEKKNSQKLGKTAFSGLGNVFVRDTDPDISSSANNLSDDDFIVYNKEKRA